MNIQPLVSVIIPCYRQAHFLSDCVASLQSQTYRHWEAIIVNDGSPDNTVEVANELARRDSRIRLVTKENGGLSSARNSGLEVASGDFIQFLDADDLIDSKKFELQLFRDKFYLNGDISISSYVTCNNEFVDQKSEAYLPVEINGKVSVYEICGDWETRLSIPVHCFLIRRSFFESAGFFDINLPNHEDWDCWIRLFTRTNRISLVSEKLAVYRVGHNSMARDLSQMREGFLQVIDKYCGRDECFPGMHAILRLKRSEVISRYSILSSAHAGNVNGGVMHRVVRKIKSFGMQLARRIQV